MSESEVENDAFLVNARDSLHYLRNYPYFFHENGLISIPTDYTCQESRSQSVYGMCPYCSNPCLRSLWSAMKLWFIKTVQIVYPRLSVYFCPLRISKRFRAKFRAASDCLLKVATTQIKGKNFFVIFDMKCPSSPSS